MVVGRLVHRVAYHEIKGNRRLAGSASFLPSDFNISLNSFLAALLPLSPM